MTWKRLSLITVTVSLLGLLAACQPAPIAAPLVNEGNEPIAEVAPTMDELEAEPESEVTETMDEPIAESESAFAPLPQRTGQRTQTTGSVPHVQIGVETIEAVNDELHRRAFALPDVESNPTIASLPGATGMWLSDEAPVVRPEVIVAGREFAHIHPDGSLHAPLPYERALEAVEKGWAERHPWADERDGWDGFVMLFTPQSMDELDVTFQLIVESYNHVTGRTVQASDFTN